MGHDLANVRVVSDPDAVAVAAVAEIAAAIRSAEARRAKPMIMLSGGSTPARTYSILADNPDTGIDWSTVTWWIGDERFVPRDDPRSNAGMIERTLLEPLRRKGIRISHEHRRFFDTDEALHSKADAPRCAASFLERTRTEGLDPETIEFDLILLGVGPDGHILSVFPDNRRGSDAPIVHGVPAPTHIEPHVPRITFGARVLDRARKIVVLAAGLGKAATIARVLDSTDSGSLPASYAVRASATWILDEAAASALRRDDP